LGQTLFLKYVLINKGENTIDSTFISLWADPDLGNSSDDLVGCDTLLSLGYCYNDGADSDYGAAPPAVGFDFLRGPLVPGTDADTAFHRGRLRLRFRNLPMTSFNKYINGTDPHSRTETYNYMKGLQPDGSPVVDPEGDTTKFYHAGNPVTGQGWIDEAAADRRYMMSSGPFTMAPGDTQEVVAAVVVGQGSNPLNSIDALKLVDEQAQAEFDELFGFHSVCGDIDGSGRITLLDAIYIIFYLFKDSDVLALGRADLNCDAKVNLTDAVSLIYHIFWNSPIPCSACGSL
jgi:hypothetical protein